MEGWIPLPFSGRGGLFFLEDNYRIDRNLVGRRCAVRWAFERTIERHSLFRRNQENKRIGFDLIMRVSTQYKSSASRITI
jgi:hypothetical protein